MVVKASSEGHGQVCTKVSLITQIVRTKFKGGACVASTTALFDPQTLVLLEAVFDDAWLTLKSVGNRTVKPDELARAVLRLAMEGERDPIRLSDGALEGLVPATTCARRAERSVTKLAYAPTHRTQQCTEPAPRIQRYSTRHQSCFASTESRLPFEVLICRKREFSRRSSMTRSRRTRFAQGCRRSGTGTGGDWRWLGTPLQLIPADLVQPADCETERERD